MAVCCFCGRRSRRQKLSTLNKINCQSHPHPWVETLWRCALSELDELRGSILHKPWRLADAVAAAAGVALCLADPVSDRLRRRFKLLRQFLRRAWEPVEPRHWRGTPRPPDSSHTSPAHASDRRAPPGGALGSQYGVQFGCDARSPRGRARMPANRASRKPWRAYSHRDSLLRHGSACSNPLEGRPRFGLEGGIAVIQTNSMRLYYEIRSTVAGRRLQAEQFV
jgi:hypothetical protein